MAYSIIAFLLH